MNIGRMLFAAILIATFVFGAFISYIWVIGYYVSLELKVPENPVIAIYNFTVSVENPTFFNITVLNPSFSPERIRILGINVLTEDEIVHRIISTNPNIPSDGYTLEAGKSETFSCFWEWVNYTGRGINVLIFVEGGSGGALQVNLPLVDLKVMDFHLNPEHGSIFNITVRNSYESVSGINLTGIKIIVGNLTQRVITQPPLPVRLEPNASVTLSGSWNWALYQGERIKIIVNTAQGYIAEKTEVIPEYVIFSIRDVGFNLTDTSHLNLTIVNSENSIVPLNITRIAFILENGTTVAPTLTTPILPYLLSRNSTVTFTCEWDWSTYRDRILTIVVDTLQGYRATRTYKTP